MEISEEHLNILRKYFPLASLPIVSRWIVSYGIFLNITKERKSRHGDFSYRPHEGMYRISVNGSLNPYAFLLTFTHEVAHLSVYKEKGRRVMPHGREWKDTFRTMMLSLPLYEIYPHDILVALADYLKNPLASTDRHAALSLALSSYDIYGKKIIPPVDDPTCKIDDLNPGDRFIFRENEYELGTKRRRLYLCTRTKDRKQYLFQPQAVVKKVKTNHQK